MIAPMSMTQELSVSDTVCGSSLRAVDIDTTLARAMELGPRLGITRVTDTTRLDRIGIPVFAGIRPDARTGSLCVHAGKGLTAREAQASAWMEAIEFALAQPDLSAASVVVATARDVLDGQDRPDAILDLCPLLDARIPLDAPLLCVWAEDLLSGEPLLTPAELAYYPAPGDGALPCYFGANTTGLASGNTLLEATVHGLAEVIERDIRSFRLIRDTSFLVQPASFPPAARALADSIRNAGMELYVRYQPNDYGLPYFDAVLYDPGETSPLFCNGGTGCHPHRSIALIRAICEAAQSRLSIIHGGRDDVGAKFLYWRNQPQEAQRKKVAQLLCWARGEQQVMAYNDIVDCSHETPDLSSCYRKLVHVLQHAGMRRICRVVHTKPEYVLHVVKLIVPRMEDFGHEPHRLGKRLRDYAAQV